MSLTPHAFCWIDGLCHWVKLSVFGCIIVMSSEGFVSEDEARADFARWFI